MRIDLLLKYLCLAKSRARAKTLCESGAVTINAVLAKPSSQVQKGDRLSIQLQAWTEVIEILQIPASQVSKKAAAQYYRTVFRRDVSGNHNNLIV